MHPNPKIPALIGDCPPFVQSPDIVQERAGGQNVQAGDRYREQRILIAVHHSRRSLLAAMSTTPLIPSHASLGVQTALSGSANAIDKIAATPEEFGAVGDGVTDDSAAIQRAIDALARRDGDGILMLRPRIAYRCDTGLHFDASRLSLWGSGLLDFARCRDTCIRISASSVAPALTPAHNYGHRGMISGALRLRGGGAARTAIGILFDTDESGTSTQMLIENFSISGCANGVEFRRHAYNSLFLHCDIFDCKTAICWRNAEDNGERNTFIGCAIFNSDVAVRMEQPDGAVYLNNCSLDYTSVLYDVAGGRIFATDCHHESDRWTGRPFRCAGDGAGIHVTGGIIVGQADPLPCDVMVAVGKSAYVRWDGVFLHNIILRQGNDRVPCWAEGEGDMHIARCETTEFDRLPFRLHASRTGLSDPDFAASSWEDLVWRTYDTRPITDRYGTAASNLQLRRVRTPGETALLVANAPNNPSAGAVALIAMPVRPGESVLSGFLIRRDSRQTGSGGVADVCPTWFRIDGMDANRVPVVVRSHSVGTLEVNPPVDRFVPVTPLASRTNRTAPSWATHFGMVVDMTKAKGAAFLFKGLWVDLT